MSQIWTMVLFLLGAVRGKEVCYERLGCFTDEAPWAWTAQRPFPALPWSPEEINTRFLLYTRDTLANYQVITATNLSTIATSSFRWDKAIRFIIHGLTDKAEGNWVMHMCLKMLLMEDVNCIGVDWRDGTPSSIKFIEAANNIRVVGAEVAYFIEALMETFNCSLSKFHLIGHSLGAHAAGEVGKRRPGIVRITGLDPAWPYFRNTPAEVRLDRSDARLVDIIHTDASLSKGVAIPEPIGHLDFYPNGGEQMAGCGITNMFSRVLKTTSFQRGILEVVMCNHFRAFHYYSESIISRGGFLGYPCATYKSFQNGECFPCPDSGCPMMGHYADIHHNIKNETQTFYLNTGSAGTYSRWRYKVSVKLPSHRLPLEIFVALFGEKGSTPEYYIQRQNSLYFSFIDAEVNLGDVYEVALRWKPTFLGLFQQFPNTFGAESVTVLAGKDGSMFTFCSNGTVKAGALQLLTPC